MSTPSPQWFVLDVNPYPWKVPPFSPGRKGNRLYVQAGRDEGLHTYKQAIREQIEAQGYTRVEGPVELFFWFWRNLATYTSQKGKRVRKHEADTTNMQKATEDALQDLVIGNDSNVESIHARRVMQGPHTPGICVVCVAPYVPTGGDAMGLPEPVMAQVRALVARAISAPPIESNLWNPMRGGSRE